MDKSFSTGDANPLDSVFNIPATGQNPGKEQIRVLLVGSRTVVTSTIYNLYSLGFAEVGDWSPLLPAPSTGEVMSILIRYIPVN